MIHPYEEKDSNLGEKNLSIDEHVTKDDGGWLRRDIAGGMVVITWASEQQGFYIYYFVLNLYGVDEFRVKITNGQEGSLKISFLTCEFRIKSHHH